MSMRSIGAGNPVASVIASAAESGAHRRVTLPLEFVHDAAAHCGVVVNHQDCELPRWRERGHAPLDRQRLQAARQEHRHAAAAARRARRHNPTASLLHDRGAGGEPEARALARLLGREERIEDVREHVGAHPHAVVYDVDADVRAYDRAGIGGDVAHLDADRAGIDDRVVALTTRFRMTCSSCV